MGEQPVDTRLKKDQKVRILIGGPNDQVAVGTVRVIQDTPGKKVGVELDEYAETAHQLDGKLEVPLKVDEPNGRIFGKGWWTLEENLETL